MLHYIGLDLLINLRATKLDNHTRPIPCLVHIGVASEIKG